MDYVPNKKLLGLFDKVSQTCQFVIVSSSNNSDIKLEAYLLEIKFGYLEKFYLSWLWSKSYRVLAQKCWVTWVNRITWHGYPFAEKYCHNTRDVLR